MAHELKKFVDDGIELRLVEFRDDDEGGARLIARIAITETNSPYDQGIFDFDIRVRQDYPFKPPRIVMNTPIYHPNFNQFGQVSIDILCEQWSPALTILRCL